MYEQTSMIGPQTAARYYEINEETARNAHYCVHMSDYKPGSATAEYRRAVDKAAALVEAKKARVSPFYHDKLDALPGASRSGRTPTTAIRPATPASSFPAQAATICASTKSRCPVKAPSGRSTTRSRPS